MASPKKVKVHQKPEAKPAAAPEQKEMIKDDSTSMQLANELLRLKETAADTKEKIEGIETDLVKAMKDENRSKIIVAGHTFTVKYVASKEKVQIQKPR